ncbi:putative thiazole-containing bacteriocin maturation protein [Brevibacillus sp. B_LB10_24]|uniref:putative thiazole-containing bacteriocin maturation protein n=1 Tax=Brevibacillus sp. B_LB10_24 TaxID=3380645 RepID=UPI0038BBCE2B
MTNLSPSSRLKVKGDTFFLPDPDGGVYFRNNTGSVRIEGRAIDQWIEILMPMFNGEHTMEDLTDGLSDQHRERVYEIAEMLYENGFARDVSQDRPHQLAAEVLSKYASQIEFLDHFVGSGAYRFQNYRQTEVLAVGSGPFFTSLVAALLESGLPKLHVLITDSLPTNRVRLDELAAHARKTDPEVSLEEVTLSNGGMSAWQEAVDPFESILYVSQQGDVEELRMLQAVCREKGKVLLPAMFLKQAGLAGPLVHPDSERCFESAWRRIHQSAVCKDPQLHAYSPTAGAMLANVIVFELFKTVAGAAESEGQNQFFLLDLETLEGSWHSFLPHPLITGLPTAKRIENLEQKLKEGWDSEEPGELLPFFSRLTSPISGVFHVWEQGDLKQLPLAQCRVQAADPLSEGPAKLLPDMICTGLTHEEAMREAGLAGIEMYWSQMADLLVPVRGESRECIGIGAGETIAEGVCRGLQSCLAEELRKRTAGQKPSVFRVHLDEVEDERCRFYLQALNTLIGETAICLGEEVSGFPVVWAGAGGRWWGSAGLNVTIALRKALQQGLFWGQNQVAPAELLEVSDVLPDEKGPQSLAIPAYDAGDYRELLYSSMQVLKQVRRRLEVLELTLEPFMKEQLAGVFGVLLREEESR